MTRQHIKCWIWKTLWGLGLWSFLFGLIFNSNREFWYFNALILGILAISIKLDCQSCRVCE